MHEYRTGLTSLHDGRCLIKFRKSEQNKFILVFPFWGQVGILFCKLNIFATLVFFLVFLYRINNYYNHNSPEENIVKIREYFLIIFDRKNSDKQNWNRPNRRTNQICKPKFGTRHAVWPSNIRNKRTKEIMKFCAKDKPEPIFLDLFFYPRKLSRTSSKNGTVFLKCLRGAISSEEISWSISETRSYKGEECGKWKDIPFPRNKKPSNQNHHIHPRNNSSNERKWFCYSCHKKYQIIPWSPWLNLHPYPINRMLYNLRTKKSRKTQHNHNCEKYSMDDKKCSIDNSTNFFERHAMSIGNFA